MMNRILFHIVKYFRPEMVGRYRRADGKVLPRTRVSNTTYIGNPEKLDIQDNVFIGHHNFIDASNGMVIEEGCQITNFISLLTHSSHISIRLYGNAYNSEKNMKGYITGPVHIGKYSFIGPHSVIMPCTRIGKGCIVSAYSYVQGDFPDFSIISGNPAEITGDTRKIDAPFLQQHPDLAKHYKQWTEQ